MTAIIIEEFLGTPYRSPILERLILIATLPRQEQYPSGKAHHLIPDNILESHLDGIKYKSSFYVKGSIAREPLETHSQPWWNSDENTPLPLPHYTKHHFIKPYQYCKPVKQHRTHAQRRQLYGQTQRSIR